MTNQIFRGHILVSGVVNTLFKNSFFNRLKAMHEIKATLAATIEEIETILLIKNAIINDVIPSRKIIGEYPSNAPAPDDTAFPPLNFKNTGNTWPSTANSPYNIGLNKHHSCGKILNRNKNTNRNPLKLSSKKVI